MLEQIESISESLGVPRLARVSRAIAGRPYTPLRSIGFLPTAGVCQTVGLALEFRELEETFGDLPQM